MTDDELDLLVGSTSPFADDRLAGLALPTFDHDLPEDVMSTSHPDAGSPAPSPAGEPDEPDYIAALTPGANSSRSTTRRARRQRVALVAAAVALVAGGTFVTLHRPSETPLPVASPNQAADEPPVLDGSPPPIDALVARSQAGQQVHNDAQIILTKQCMATQGFTYDVDPATVTDGGLEPLPFGAQSDSDLVAQPPADVGPDNPLAPAGFGEALYGTDADALPVVGLLPGAASVALPAGCYGGADRQLAGGDTARAALEQLPLTLIPLQAAAATTVKGSPAYGPIVGAWHDCMAVAGFGSVTDPGAVGVADTPAARQDLVCKTRTNFLPQVDNLLTVEQTKVLQPFPGLVDQVGAAIQHVHDESTAVVAGGSTGS